jgi:two-component system, OmpR family, sensor kinase
VTLRGRLLAAFAYLLVLTVIALAVPLAVNVDRRAKDAFYAGIDSQTQVIAASLGGSPAPGGTLAGVRRAVARYGRETDARVVVTDGRGALLADSNRPRPARVAFATAGRPEISTALAGGGIRLIRHSTDLGGDLLVVAYPVLDQGRVVGAVRLSQPIAAVDSRVHRSWFAIAGVAAAVGLVGLAVAWLLASSLARPIHAVGTTAGRLGRGDLAARAPESGPAEVADVARALNRMADELVGLIEAQREFVANASHQLRTPLTGLRLRLESLAAGPESTDAQAGLREVDRLSELVADLLVLARAGVPPPAPASCDLRQEARAAADRWRQVAAEHAGTLALEEPPGPVAVAADAADVAAALDNLIENAIVYTPEGSTVALSVTGDGVVRVRDDGPGIDPAEAARVFDRFYRGSAGRETPGGTGLGLAIVRDLAARWGGAAELEPGGPGTTIAVRFPPGGEVEIAGPEPSPNPPPPPPNLS